MNRYVQAYINKQKELAEKKKLENRAEFLEEINLFNRVYSDSTYYSDEYPIKDTDEASESFGKYYKNEPLTLSDEEYKEVLEAYKLNHALASSDDAVAQLLFYIAIFTYIVGGLLALLSFTAGAFTGIAAIVSVFVSGTSFLGFSRIISLLNDIKNK